MSEQEYAWREFQSQGWDTPEMRRCKGRTDVFGRCDLHVGHKGQHVNALGEKFSVVGEPAERRE